MPTTGSWCCCCLGWSSECECVGVEDEAVVVVGACIAGVPAGAEAIGKVAVGCEVAGSEVGMPTYCCVDAGVGVECCG